MSNINTLPMLKFVSANPENQGPKRKQAARACDRCRRGKRRCNHIVVRDSSDILKEGSTRSDGSQVSQSTPSASQHEFNHQNAIRQTERAVCHSPNESAQSQETRSEWRSLESSQHAALPAHIRTSPDVMQDPDALESRFVGDLNPEGMFYAATSPESARGATIKHSIGTWLAERRSKGPDMLNPPALSDQSASGLFYGSSSMLQKTLLPLLREECLLSLPSAEDLNALSSIYYEKVHAIMPIIDIQTLQDLGPEDPAKVLLLQGICLAASMNYVSRPHLRLSNAGPLLSYREFGRRLHAAMRISIETGVVAKKIVLIQALALMSLFADGPDGGDLSSQFCGRAVHYVHSLGLHHTQASRTVQTDSYATSLLCCVWALDRMNAAFHGRPVLMHERDIERDLQACFAQQEPCFRLFLQIVVLLDRVIALYRPQSVLTSPSWEEEFPSFEDLLAQCGSLQTPTPFLATIETLYHAVAILSCRNRSWEMPSRSSASYVRQSFSASRVTAIVDHEFRNQLVLLPFVPYAVSLSLRIAYRELRHSKAPMYRTRARTLLHTNCKVLARLGLIFWSASIMAEMGESTLQELDRVYSVVTEAQQRKGQDVRAEGTSNSINVNDNTRRSSITRQAEPLHQSSAMSDVRSGNTPQPLQDLDFSLLDDLPEMDVFAMFDSDFDLDGIDACLGGNLGLPFSNMLQ